MGDEVTEHGSIIIDTPEGMEFFRLAARKGALGLELHGLKRRGQSAYSICKQVYGLKGNRQSVYNQMEKLVEDAIAAKHAKDVQTAYNAELEANARADAEFNS